jgi:hypothetical protein
MRQEGKSDFCKNFFGGVDEAAVRQLVDRGTQRRRRHLSRNPFLRKQVRRISAMSGGR